MAKRSAKVTNRQREILLNFMEEHPELVSGRFTSTFTKQVHDKLWEEIKNRLNSDGSGATKDIAKWKKCWTSWKSDTKTKAAQGKKKPTGGGERADIDLTPLETRLVAVIGDIVIEGNPLIDEGGIPQYLLPNAVPEPQQAPPLDLINRCLSTTPQFMPAVNDGNYENGISGKTYTINGCDNLSFSIMSENENIAACGLNVVCSNDENVPTAKEQLSASSSTNRKRLFSKPTLRSSKKKRQADDKSHFERAADALRELKESKIEALRNIEYAILKSASANEEIATAEKSKAESFKVVATALTSISQLLGTYFVNK